jgi:hypothetical protein|tara:strand:- start:14 stop:223 length:210 start_codon:yes stop_codon:yes gene_type:complete
MKYAAGFTYDNEHGEMDEWIVERKQFNWLIESLEEYMPKRKNSEIVWATMVDDEPHPEMDITQKVIQTL